MSTKAHTQSRPSHLGSPQRISERGRRRLDIAARLLKLDVARHETSEVDFAAVLAAIGRLSNEGQAVLRSHVDWVEAYEWAERELQRCSG